MAAAMAGFGKRGGGGRVEGTNGTNAGLDTVVQVFGQSGSRGKEVGKVGKRSRLKRRHTGQLYFAGEQRRPSIHWHSLASTGLTGGGRYKHAGGSPPLVSLLAPNRRSTTTWTRATRPAAVRGIHVYSTLEVRAYWIVPTVPIHAHVQLTHSLVSMSSTTTHDLVCTEASRPCCRISPSSQQTHGSCQSALSS